METMERGKNLPAGLLASDFSPEHIAVAVLMERFRNLPKEAYADLMELGYELSRCQTNEEGMDIMETMREILFPEQIGGIQKGHAGSIHQTENLKKRMDWIGTRIKEKRKEQGLTQEQLAEKTGLPQSHISRLEAGEHSPSCKTLEKIAAALNISAGDLDPSHG